MRLTSSFAVFRADPGEQDLSKARWYGRDGKIEAAVQEYRAALQRNPDMAAGWMELFELLRRAGRLDEALQVALESGRQFGPEAAMPLALEGAALAELGRVKEAVASLEGALERDGNLALAWHELAYAAYRVGEFARALLALDRAFALEPHTDTLMLRGRILREAGQYEAALVAFEAAHQSAEHDVPKRDAEREMAATRRAAALGGKRPRDFTARERLFAETGSAVLIADANGDPAEQLSRAVLAVPALVRHVGWHPGAVAGVRDLDLPLAQYLAHALGAHLVAAAALDPADRPLVVTISNNGAAEWEKQTQRLVRWRAGTSLALVQAPGTGDPADLVGIVRALAPEQAAAAAQAALQWREPKPPPDVEEPARLLGNLEAPWRRRLHPA